MKPLNTIIQAIRLAHLDNLNSVEVLLEDLLVLIKEIELQQTYIKSANKEKLYAITKLNLIELEKPIKLDIYT